MVAVVDLGEELEVILRDLEGWEVLALHLDWLIHWQKIKQADIVIICSNLCLEGAWYRRTYKTHYLAV